MARKDIISFSIANYPNDHQASLRECSKSRDTRSCSTRNVAGVHCTPIKVELFIKRMIFQNDQAKYSLIHFYKRL